MALLQFTNKSSERILKIKSHLAKLWEKVLKGPDFFDSHCSMFSMSLI